MSINIPDINFIAYHNKPVTTFAPHLENGVPQYPKILFQGIASKRNVAFFPDSILQSVFVKKKRDTPIPYTVSTVFDRIEGSTTDAIAEVYKGIAQAMFTRYYETNLSKIKGIWQ